MGHGIVLNRVVLYYGSGEKIRHTIGYIDSDLCLRTSESYGSRLVSSLSRHIREKMREKIKEKV
jgi:hypothetical protein